MSKHHSAYRRFMTPLKSRERANVAPRINVGGIFDRRVIGGGLLSRRVTDWRANVGKSMLWHLPFSPPCDMHHCALAVNNSFQMPVSPSLYSRWLRLSRLSWEIAIRLVPDRKWSPHIPSDPIAIKCWSRQALYLTQTVTHIINIQHWIKLWGRLFYAFE